MIWILLVIAAALAVVALFIALGARKAVITILAIVLVGIAGLIWYGEVYDKQKSNVVAAQQVQLSNVQMTPVYRGSYQLTARVRNNSTSHVLTGFGLTVTASDCTDQSTTARCEVVGEQSKEIRVEIPTQQSRDIIDQFGFDSIRPIGHLRWGHRIDYIKTR